MIRRTSAPVSEPAACKVAVGNALSGVPPRRSGSVEQTAHLVTPGQTPSTVPIIGLPALLRLVEWYQERRRKTEQGGSLCSNLEPSLSPPVPREVKSSSQFSAAVVDLLAFSPSGMESAYRRTGRPRKLAAIKLPLLSKIARVEPPSYIANIGPVPLS